MRNPPKGIIVIEGADCAGKTTLANSIIDYVGEENCLYLHAGIADDFWELHFDMVQKAIDNCDKKLVIIDRLWLSEMAYGPMYRGGPQYTYQARVLDRLLLKHGAVNVLCVPQDAKKHITEFDKIKKERDEHFNNITEVIHWYHNLAYGNLMIEPKCYASQFIAMGDYTKRPDVILYDRFTQSLSWITNKTLTLLKHINSIQHQDFLDKKLKDVAGSMGYSKALFVVDGLLQNPKSNKDFSRKDVINIALHEAQINEMNVAYVDINRISPSNGDMTTQERLIKDAVIYYKKPVVISIGKKAKQICDKLGVYSHNLMVTDDLSKEIAEIFMRKLELGRE